MARNNYENLNQPVQQFSIKHDIDQVYFSKLLSNLNEFKEQLSVLQYIEDTSTKHLTKYHCQEISRHTEQIIRHLNTVMIYCKKSIDNTAKAKQEQSPLLVKQTTGTRTLFNSDDASAKNDAKVVDLFEKSITAVETENTRDKKVERSASMKYIQHWETILDKQHIYEPFQNYKKVVESDLVKKRVNQFNNKERRKSSTVFSYLNMADDKINNEDEKKVFSYKYRSEPRGLNELHITTITENKEELAENISLEENVYNLQEENINNLQEKNIKKGTVLIHSIY